MPWSNSETRIESSTEAQQSLHAGDHLPSSRGTLGMKAKSHPVHHAQKAMPARCQQATPSPGGSPLAWGCGSMVRKWAIREMPAACALWAESNPAAML